MRKVFQNRIFQLSFYPLLNSINENIFGTRFFYRYTLTSLKGFDLYLYVQNNPKNRKDLYGLYDIGKAFGHLSTAWSGVTAPGPGALFGGILGGLIGGVFFGTPGTIVVGAFGGLLGSVFDSPSAGQLNYLEKSQLEIDLNMKEWKELDRKAQKLLEEAESLNNQMGGSLDDISCRQ